MEGWKGVQSSGYLSEPGFPDFQDKTPLIR